MKSLGKVLEYPFREPMPSEKQSLFYYYTIYNSPPDLTKGRSVFP